VDTNELAIPVDINERNQLAIPSANATEPLIFTLETNEPSVKDAFTLEIDERAELLVEDTFTFIIDYCSTGSSIPKSLLTTTLTLPPSIPTTGFGQFHGL
jgi:hypothetical protein